MPELESPDAAADDADSAAGGTIELPDGAGGGRLRLPESATNAEAAAVAAAIGAHLTDRQRAHRAAAAGAADEGPERQNDWILAARLDRTDTHPWHETAVGDEWRAASRQRRR